MTAPKDAATPRPWEGNEPHTWVLNLTCRNCGITGDHDESFPCCEHVEPLRVVVRQLARALVGLAPYPPEVSEGVVATLETAREMVGDSVETWRELFASSDGAALALAGVES